MSESAGELEETSAPKYVNHLGLLHHFDYFSVSRQKQERNVLEALLRMVPGLEERLTERTPGDIASIAEKVSLRSPYYILSHLALCSQFRSYKRECLVLGQTTQRV